MIPACQRAYRSLAAADQATTRSVNKDQPRSGAPRDPEATAAPESPPSLRRWETHVHARCIYARRRIIRARKRALDNPADAELRGEAAHAIAGVEYFDLKEWRASAESAATAQQLFGSPRSLSPRARTRRSPPPRGLRWRPIQRSGMRVSALNGPSMSSCKNLGSFFAKLFQFHIRSCYEPYDAALQMNNIGVAYSYGEGRFRECVGRCPLGE